MTGADPHHDEDLALAQACARGDGAALQAFQARHEADIDLTLTRLGFDPGLAGDVKSTVLEKLLAPPSVKIAQYTGQGPLGAWVKAVTTREALSVRRTAARRRDLLEAAGDALTPIDPELAFLKRHYRDAFREAFGATVEGLSAEDRTILRYRFVDALTLPQLAAACGVHRATVARRLATLRERLFEDTRGHMTQHLDVPADELESIFRLIQSNFEVSMRRLLD